MAKKQTATTKKQAIANAKAYYEQLEMKKGQQGAKTATPSTDAPETRARARNAPKKAAPKVSSRASTVRSNATTRTSARDGPTSSSTCRPTTQESARIQQFYQNLMEKEDSKKTSCSTTFNGSSSQYTRATRTNVPSTVFCSAQNTPPHKTQEQSYLNPKAARRVQQFYETLSAKEMEKRGSSEVSIASSSEYSETPPAPTIKRNTRSQFVRRSEIRNETTPTEHHDISLNNRQRVLDGIAIFAACFFVKSFSVAMPSVATSLFSFCLRQMSQLAWTCGSIALQITLATGMALGFVGAGRLALTKLFMAPPLDQPEKLHQDIESIKVLVYHELMTQPDVGVTEISLRDLILSRHLEDLMHERQALRPISEREKNYFRETVWPEAATQLNREPRILKINVRVGQGMETIWSWSDKTFNGTIPKKRKVT